MTETKTTGMSDSVSVNLTNPIKFAKDGAVEDVFEITVHCHTRKHYKKTLFFKQAMTKAVFSMRSISGGEEDLKDESAKEEGEENVMDGGTVMIAMSLSDVDLEDLIDRFEKLSQTGIVKVEGIAINTIQLDDIDPDDLQVAMGEYIANFIMPSVMKTFGTISNS